MRIGPSDVQDIAKRLSDVYTILTDKGMIAEADAVERAALTLLAFAAYVYRDMDAKRGTEHPIH